MFDCLCLFCFVDLPEGEELVLPPLESGLFVCRLDVVIDAALA